MDRNECRKLVSGTVFNGANLDYFVGITGDFMRLSIIIAFLLVNFSFASLLWTVNADVAVSKNLLKFSNNVVATNEEGYVYLISPQNGNVLWNKKINGLTRKPIIFDNQILVSNDSTLFLIDTVGNLKTLASDFRGIYGYAADNNIYITSQGGVFSVNKKGDKKFLFNSTNLTSTEPVLNGKRIIFGYGTQLISIDTTGNLIWKKNIGQVWNGNPSVVGSQVYIGTLDNRLYAFDTEDGFPKWNFYTGNWVVSTPYAADGTVYFGSNNGNLYAIDINSGKEKWSTQTKGAIQSIPSEGKLGGNEVIFAGSQDGSLYAFNTEDGSIVFKYSAKDWVYSPLVVDKTVIFSSHDGLIYAINTDKTCTIESPTPDYLLGNREVFIKGKIFTEFSNQKVQIRLNDGEWEEAAIEHGSWVYRLDPSKLPSGLNKVECRAGDSSGFESSPFTNTVLTKSEDAPIENLIVEYPKIVQIGQQIVIKVSDFEGNLIDNAGITFQGKKYNSDNTTKIFSNSAGKQKIVVQKTGFVDYIGYIEVKQAQTTEIIYLLLGVLVLLLSLFFIYRKFIAKPKTS